MVAEPTATEPPEPAARSLRALLLIGAGWLLLAAFDVWLLLIRPAAPWDTKISFVLGVLGVYTFAFGILAQTGLLRVFPDQGESLTSPNPMRFLAGSFEAVGLLQLVVSVGMRPERTPESLDRRGGSLLQLVQLPVLLVEFVLVVAFTVLYLVVIAPLAWIAYAIVSVPLDAITGSGRDVAVGLVDPRTGAKTEPVYLKQVVVENLVTLRNLLVAVPALLSSLILDAPKLI
jgi:hypothetical protein